jgi:tRNA dimethylallyltransferase
VAGPTASGKSDTAVELALRLGGSVISADSMQVYRGMDIGSAKITEAEKRGVPHYLIDCIDPEEEWNVVTFQEQARQAIRQILDQGRLPILCGGTGFYIQSVLYDIDFTEMDSQPDYRLALEREAGEKGPQVLYDRLVLADPEAARAIHPNNVKRVIRALEFHQKSGGQKISRHNEEQRARQAAYDCVFYVLTMDLTRLYERIDRRVDIMMEKGLVREVQELRERGLTSEDVSMQGLGYKEFFPYFDGEKSLDECIAEVKKATRNYVKRQMTFFLHQFNIEWIKGEEDVLEAISHE